MSAKKRVDILIKIVKLNERGDDMMFDNYELKDLIEEFNDEIDEDIEKALKEMPEKLKEILGQAYQILVEFKEVIKDLSPELFSAIQLLGELATGKPASKYPSKVKKKGWRSEPMDWQEVQDMLFGGHLPDIDEGIEKGNQKEKRKKEYQEEYYRKHRGRYAKGRTG